MPRETAFSLRTLKAIGRRGAAVGVAATIVLVPALVASPAFAEPVAPFPITALSFSATVLSGGEQLSGYFNDIPSMTSITIPGPGYACEARYNNGVPLEDGTALGSASPYANYDALVASYGFVQGDEFGLAYFEPNSDAEPGSDPCAAPALNAPGVVSATVMLGAPSVPLSDICAVSSTVTVATITLTQGVAVDQLIPYEIAAEFDWTSGSGWISSGPQNSGDEFIPFGGLSFISQDPMPGVAPSVRLVGTPFYSGEISTPFELCDGTHYAAADLILQIAAPANNVAINLNLATGQPVAGATTQVFASGLQPAADWSVTVRSTPIVVGSGTVPSNGQLAGSFTIPAGLGKGLHSITLASTLADGSAVTSTLWFTVSATGTLLAISTDPDSLADTGIESGLAIATASALLLGGMMLMGLVAYRRRKLTAQN